MARHYNCACIVRDGNGAGKTEVARSCGRRHNSGLSLLSCDPAIQMDCAGISHVANRSEYRRWSFSPVAGMDIVLSCRGILRVVIGNSDERVNFELHFAPQIAHILPVH